MGYKGTIGVVSPFRAQANRINDLVHKDQSLSEQLITRDFLADTVHRFQGDERDIIIFSPVISNGIGNGSTLFLSRTGNLFNVAITRARAALIIVGDKNVCGSCGIKFMERFAEYVTTIKSNTIEHKSSENDFGQKYPSIPSTSLVSDWEKKFYEALYKKGIRTIPQYQVEQYALDLALFHKGRRLDIEIDGEKYHRNWDGELCRRDQLRNKRLIELGWDVLRFWVYEIRDDIEGSVNKVQEWIDSE
jgi:very-short-patch-repair endonuclease